MGKGAFADSLSDWSKPVPKLPLRGPQVGFSYPGKQDFLHNGSIIQIILQLTILFTVPWLAILLSRQDQARLCRPLLMFQTKPPHFHLIDSADLSLYDIVIDSFLEDI